MSQKESEWTEELKKVYDSESGNPRLIVMESFIKELLSNREKEIAEEVEKAYKEKSSQLHGGYDDADYLNAYGMAIHDVLQLLKH